MSPGLFAMLLGLFGVPAGLLYLGHRLRRRSRRTRRTFWGAFFGHTIAALFATWYSMIPPEAWTSTDLVRGGFGFYGMLVGGVIGGLLGYLTSGSQHTN